VKLVRDVVKAVREFVAPLLLGQGARKADKPRALTLSMGFDRALDLRSGKYATRTRRWEEVSRARRKIERILGKHTEWQAIKPGDVRKIWRLLANENRNAPTTARPTGARQAEVTVDVLYSVAAWLRDEGLLTSDALLPPTKWRSNLKAEWEKIVGRKVTPQRPRHTEDEMRRLFANLHSAKIDPRFALAFNPAGNSGLGRSCAACGPIWNCLRSTAPWMDRTL
jgi:hypothetical protein